MRQLRQVLRFNERQVALIAVIHGIQQSIVPSSSRRRANATRRPAASSTPSCRNPEGGEPMAKSGVTYVNPPSAPQPAGMYSHVARMAPGELAFIAGQVAVEQGHVSGRRRSGRAGQTGVRQPRRILKDLGADFEFVVQFTTYLTQATTSRSGCRRVPSCFRRSSRAASIRPTRCS